MKYAIILQVIDRKYLTGFTNTKIEKTNTNPEDSGIKYTVELKEVKGLFLKLEGDAKEYLS